MRRKRSLRPFLFTWLPCWVFWLVLSDSTGWREMVVGALASAITLVAVAAFVAATGANYGIRKKFLLQAIHVPEILMEGLGVLLAAMALQMRGKKVPSGIVVVRFDPGEDGPVSRARRAFAITYLTFAPNNLVFGILREKEIFFFHTVIPQPLPPFVVRLGAKPESES